MRYLFSRIHLYGNRLSQQHVKCLLSENLITSLLRDVGLRNSLLRNLCSLADRRRGSSVEEVLEELAGQEPPRWFMEKYTCPSLEDTLCEEDIVETVSQSGDSNQFSSPGIEPVRNQWRLAYVT